MDDGHCRHCNKAYIAGIIPRLCVSSKRVYFARKRLSRIRTEPAGFRNAMFRFPVISFYSSFGELVTPPSDDECAGTFGSRGLSVDLQVALRTRVALDRAIKDWLVKSPARKVVFRGKTLLSCKHIANTYPRHQSRRSIGDIRV